MGLTKSIIRDRARALLDEAVAGFWSNTELENWIDDAAIDISTKTYCCEVSGSVTLATGVQIYNVSTDYIKILGAVYASEGLKQITPWMTGLQYAVSTGAPKYFFDIIDKVGFYPVPTTTENGTIVTVYYAQVTSNIANIPVKFQTPAILFVTFMGLAKERQYTKAGQLYQLYIQSLNLDKIEIAAENTLQPAPQNQYTLKLVGPQR
jgi:hypothetical protein